ncbi:hypothetical protein OU790_15225, partial [Ruegeria sp. NA]
PSSPQDVQLNALHNRFGLPPTSLASCTRSISRWAGDPDHALFQFSNLTVPDNTFHYRKPPLSREALFCVHIDCVPSSSGGGEQDQNANNHLLCLPSSKAVTIIFMDENGLLAGMDNFPNNGGNLAG